MPQAKAKQWKRDLDRKNHYGVREKPGAMKLSKTPTIIIDLLPELQRSTARHQAKVQEANHREGGGNI